MSCGCNEENKQGDIQQDPCEGMTLNSLPQIVNLSPLDILYIYDVSTGASYKVTVEQLANFFGELGNKIEPTFYKYENLTELEINYTPELKQKYGKLPTITIYDTENKIVALAEIIFDDLENASKITIRTEDEYNLIIKMS